MIGNQHAIAKTQLYVAAFLLGGVLGLLAIAADRIDRGIDRERRRRAELETELEQLQGDASSMAKELRELREQTVERTADGREPKTVRQPEPPGSEP